MKADSLAGVPFATIIIKNKNRGTSANYDGSFSIAVETGDTILFTAIGFKNASYVVPMRFDRERYAMIQVMTQDTVLLAESIVYPYPTPEEFRKAFLELEIPKNLNDRAIDNINQQYFDVLADNMDYDGNESSDYFMRQRAATYYWKGQNAPQNIFNLFSWIEFFKAIKEGRFKNKKEE